MDLQSVPQMMMKKRQNKNIGKRRRDGVKVVYISSPVKVKTSASRFRTLVQELTGKYSDIERLMEMDGYGGGGGRGGKDYEVVHEFERVSNDGNGFHVPSDDAPSVESWLRESPTSSESVSEQFDDVFSFRMEENLMFPLDFNFDSSEIDVLGSYDSL